ncbi:MAG TPA: ribosome silencing factor [Steroidobacter sp.]|nr:ribosome silencing factor [Steroidobacter sp.]
MAAKRANTSRSSGPGAAKASTRKRPAAKKTAATKAKAPMKAPTKAAARTATKARLKTAARRAGAKHTQSLLEVVEHALDEMKAVNVKVLDVQKLTDVADTMVIASGNSDRHVRSIADRLLEETKKAGFRPMGVEGERDGEWVLVDLQDVIVHIMLPRVREFYRLESLWDVSAARRAAV